MTVENTKLLIVGDLHLGKAYNLGKSRPGQVSSRFIDQARLLDWVLDRAVEYQVDRVVLTGDIFEDTKPNYALVELFFDFLWRASEENIAVDIILGNHDIRRQGQNLQSILDIIHPELFSNVRFYKDITALTLPGLHLALIPFRDRKYFGTDSAAEALKKIQEELEWETSHWVEHYPRIAIGHMGLKGSIPIGDEFDDELNELLIPLEYFDSFRAVWMGHIHKPQVLKSDAKNHLAHIGSLDLTNVDERFDTKILVFYDSAKPNDWKEISIPVRGLKKLILEVPAEVTNTTEYVLSEIEKEQSLNGSVMKLEVRLSGSADAEPLKREELMQKLGEFGVFHLASCTESRTAKILAESKVLSNDDAEKLFNPSSGLNVWASRFEFENEEDKQYFQNHLFEILNSYQEHKNLC